MLSAAVGRQGNLALKLYNIQPSAAASDPHAIQTATCHAMPSLQALLSADPAHSLVAA